MRVICKVFFSLCMFLKSNTDNSNMRLTQSNIAPPCQAAPHRVACRLHCRWQILLMMIMIVVNLVKMVIVVIRAMFPGTANDAIFMMLPMVDNFWQAQVVKAKIFFPGHHCKSSWLMQQELGNTQNQTQAVVMLTPRMPLYIPCVYNVFLYLR